MPFLSQAERHFAKAVADLSYCNPFLPERIELERLALGDAFEPTPAVWSRDADWQQERPNVTHMNERAEELVARLHERLTNGERATPDELQLYEDLVEYLLYQRYRQPLALLTEESLKATAKTHPVRFWKQFLSDYQQLLAVRGRAAATFDHAAHLLACFFQIRRAWRTFSSPSSAPRSRRPGCGPMYGNRCSRTTCAAAAVRSIVAWAILRR